MSEQLSPRQLAARTRVSAAQRLIAAAVDDLKRADFALARIPGMASVDILGLAHLLESVTREVEACKKRLAERLTLDHDPVAADEAQWQGILTEDLLTPHEETLWGLAYAGALDECMKSAAALAAEEEVRPDRNKIRDAASVGAADMADRFIVQLQGRRTASGADR